MKLAEALLQGLKDYGAKELFGIPGDFALPFFKVIETSGILPYHTLSHEPAIGFAADTTARYRSGLGVAVVTYGAGAFNMVNAAACAYAEKSPLVIISGAPGVAEGRSGLLLHHQAKSLGSQFEVFREFTCEQIVLDDPRRAPEEIARVLRTCLDQSRPVYIELPRDQVEADCAPVPLIDSPAADPDALAACADEVLAQLAEAEKPLLLAGVEVRRYGLEDKVAELSRRLGLPVATTFMGRGLLAGHDCPLIGTYLGLAGDDTITEAVEHSDCLLMLGAIVCDTNFAVSAKQIDMRHAINAADGQVKLGHHVYPSLPLAALVDTLLAKTEASRHGAEPVQASYPSGLVADEAAITPDDIARAVNDLFAEKGPMPIASDIGDCLFTAMDMDETALVAPGYYATMGFGVPAGLGLQAASGERPLVLVGDGAFQMTGWELGNCGRYGWDPIVLLFNNACWGMLDTFQPEMPYNRLDEWQFAEAAKAMNGDGVRVSTRAELKAALDQAVATRGRFQLIEIMLAEGAISSTLSRFVEAQRRLSGVKK